MNTKIRYLLILALVFFGGVVLVVMTQAAPDADILAGGSPSVVSYQGQVIVSGVPYTGNGNFKFAVVDAAGTTSYWSNDGTSSVGDMPTAAVQLAVNNGLFSVLLGDTLLSGMTQALLADVFNQQDTYLRVWFSSDNITYDQLTPDTRIAAVPYALQAQQSADADTVDGLHASELGTHYQNVVFVAKGGGDYTSVQAAIDSITDAAADNPYLVWIAPGVYSETVTMKPYVHLQGAGQDVTVITSMASSSGNWPPTQSTLMLASDVSLQDLTVDNIGTGDMNTAVLATAGMTRTLVAGVTAQALGNGASNYAIFLSGSGTSVKLQQATARAENGSNTNAGLINSNRAQAILDSGNYTALGGTDSWAIFNVLTATLKATNVTALGENGSDLNMGLWNYNNSTAVLYGGDYTGRGGTQTGGVSAQLNSTLTAIGVTALAENGSGDIGNYGMGCYDSSAATLSGGVFTARGGVNNYALSNEFNVTMKADNITALAENGSNSNHGLWNVNNAKLVLHGASLIGRGGTNAYGAYSANDGTMLEAESVAARGKNGSDKNYGLYNTGQYSSDIVTTTLRNSSFTGASGTLAYGIYISGTLTTLATESVATLGENGSTNNFGLFIVDGASATLSNGSFTASGGTNAYGIFNLNSNATLEADSITVLAENSSTNNFGLYNFNGAKATLRGGSFTGRGGDSTRGIENAQNGSILIAENVTALGENGTGAVGNYGLGSYDNVTTTLRGGSFTARGGDNTYGIANVLTATMTADNVIALGENGSGENYGLHSVAGATTTVRGGYLTGRGGTNAHGIGNFDDNTLLDAASITALGEGGSGFNFGLINGNSAPTSNATANVTQSVLEGATNSVILDSGTVTVSNSRLAGNSVSIVSGTITCVLVTRGTNISTDGVSCP